MSVMSLYQNPREKESRLWGHKWLSWRYYRDSFMIIHQSMFHVYILVVSGNKILGHFGFDWNFSSWKDMVASSEVVMETRTSKWLQI